MKKRQLMVKQLDQQLEPWQQAKKYFTPKIGWVRTLRKALGITTTQLAKKMGLHRSRITRIENDEIKGVITLQTLEKIAEALNCELKYALIPKTSVQKILYKQAEKIAKQRIKRISHSMALEDQSVEQKYQEEQIKELIEELLSGIPRHLWEDE